MTLRTLSPDVLSNLLRTPPEAVIRRGTKNVITGFDDEGNPIWEARPYERIRVGNGWIERESEEAK